MANIALDKTYQEDLKYRQYETGIMTHQLEETDI